MRRVSMQATASMSITPTGTALGAEIRGGINGVNKWG